VACAQVDFEKQRIGIGLQGAEFGDIFGGFPVHDLAVVEAGFDEHGGIVLAFNIGIRTVGLYVEVVFRKIGIAPFFIFAHGERESGVQHGVEDVDERDVTDNDVEKVGAEIRDGAHEEAASAPAFDGEVFFGGVTLGDEVFSGGDEVGESVELLFHAAGVVPSLAEFTPATNMGIGIDDAAVEETQTVGAEIDRDGDAVAAVAIKEERSGAVTRSVFVKDNGDGDASAVRRGGVEALGNVLRGIVAS